MGNNKRNKKKKSSTNKNKKQGSSSSSSINNCVPNVNTTPKLSSPSSESQEEAILSELSVKTRCLLHALKGVVPDGSPFVTEGHSLYILHESVFKLTNELMKIQNRRMIETTDRSSPHLWDNFNRWLSRCGIILSSSSERGFPVEISKNESRGYGLYATRDIGSDEVIVEIPTSVMLFGENNHMVGGKSLPPPLTLVMCLVNERWKGERSKFFDYMSILPQRYEIPLYWSFSAVLALKQTGHLKRAVLNRVLNVWDYLCVREALKTNPDGDDVIPYHYFTYQLFRWATATAHTRQNLIPLKQTDERSGDVQMREALALVPLWDIMNHEDDDITACRSEVQLRSETTDDNTDNKPILVCQTPPNKDKSKILYKKGQEIKMYYGDRSNAQLLFHSGFVNVQHVATTTNTNTNTNTIAIINTNKNDVVSLTLALPSAPADKAMSKVREMIAARFGFIAYVDQKCHHEGIPAARLASDVVTIFSNGNRCNDDSSEISDNKSPKTNASAVGDERDGCILMTEVTLSVKCPITLEFKRALLLCIADKEELNILLRHLDDYVVTNDSKEMTKSTSRNANAIPLQQKHVRFVERLVNLNLKDSDGKTIQRDMTDPTECNENDELWMSGPNVYRLSNELLCSNRQTLTSWFKAFCEEVEDEIDSSTTCP